MPAMLSLFILGSVAKTLDSLRGVGLFESINFDGINGVSFAGGGQLNIAENGDLNDTPKNNQVRLTTSDLSSTAITLNGSPLTEDDEFNSQAANGKLVYTMPDVSYLFNGLPLSTFSNFATITTELTVQNLATKDVLKCENASKCTVKYSWKHTPVVHAIIPPVIYYGQPICIMMQANQAGAYKKTGQDIVDFKIDGTTFFRGNYTYGVTTSKTGRVCYDGEVYTEHRNMTSQLTAKFRGAGYAMNSTESLPIWSLDGQSNYTLKMMPTITSIDQSEGYRTGGQTLTINGTSLDGAVVKVMVDGVVCDVKTTDKDQITCVTRSKPLPGSETTSTKSSASGSDSSSAPTIDTYSSASFSKVAGAPDKTYYVGQQGLHRFYFTNTSGINHNNWLTFIAGEQLLNKMVWTAPEIAHDETRFKRFYGFRSYFKAPDNGQYRFLMSCDDKCVLSMSSGDLHRFPESKEQLLSRGRYVPWRTFDLVDKTETSPNFGKVFSKWLTLKKDEYYYFETSVMDTGGKAAHTIGMEVQPEKMPTSHPYAETAIQKFSLGQSGLKWDTMHIRIQQPDKGKFVMMFLNPKTNKWVKSGQLLAGGTAAEIAAGIKGYYKGLFGVNPQVTLTFEDASGNTVLEGDPAIWIYVYAVEVPTPITIESVSQIMTVPMSTQSEIQYKFPKEIQLSDPPLSGKYYLECSNTDGKKYATTDIDVTSNAAAVKNLLEKDCAFLKGKIDVTQLETKYTTNTLGVEFQVHFKGISGKVELYGMKSSSEEPLVGVNIAYAAEETRPFGQTLIYQLVPPEYFYTIEEKPQIMIQVDEFPALCRHLTCDYTYKEQESIIKSFAVDGLDVTITAEKLRTVNVTHTVELAKIACTIAEADTPTETEIKCKLASAIPAGKWLPKVTDEFGLIKVDSGVTALEVALEVTEITPKSGLNPAGGNIVTIKGNNFPTSLTNLYGMTITLDKIVKCIPKTITATELTCETEPIISASRRRLVDAPLKFDMRWQTDGNEVVYEETDFTLNTSPIKMISTNPAQISPIVLRTIVIQLDQSYPATGMTKEDFSVELLPVTLEKTHLTINNGGRRPLNVIGVDTTLKTVTVKYGGAYSGTYDWLIKSVKNGNIDTTVQQLKVVFEIKNIEPLTGSIFGGTVLTITGGPFSTKLDETIVKVGFYWWDGIDNYCYLLTATKTQVTCRLPLDLNRQAKEYETIAYSATSEESNCEMDNKCLFTFIAAADLPNVTGYTVKFDEATNEWTIEVTGTGFKDTLDKIEFFLDSAKQTVLSADSTKVVINVDSLTTGLSANKMDLYFAVGLPNGYTELFAGATFTPKLVELSTNEISAAGSTIQATVKGMGVNDSLTLVEKTSGTDLCLTATMKAYGVLECELDPAQNYAAGPIDLLVKEKVSEKTHECANTDKTKCQLSLVASQPAYATVTKSLPTKLDFVGTDFDISGDYTCEVTYAKAKSDTCTITSATEVSAEFTKGVGTQATGSSPILRFVKTGGKFSHLAKPATDPAATLNFPLAITASKTGVTSSFAGGVEFEITAAGLTQNVLQSEYEVRVCQKQCVMVADKSDSDKYTCATPAIATVKSNSLFFIREEANLYGIETIYSGMTKAMADRALNNRALPSIQGSSANCHVGIKFAKNYKGVLQEMSFFLDYFNTGLIVDKLKFQASNDDFAAETVDLLTVGDDAHEGWNYFDMRVLTDGVPKYSSYRLFSASNKGCDDIGEVRFIGHEVIDDDKDEYSCEAELVQFVKDASTGVSTETITDLTAPVAYKVSQTPKLTEVSPRYGAVEGNEDIKFIGEGFPTGGDLADFTIVLDNVPCVVKAVSATEVSCKTGPRIGKWEQDPKLEFAIKNVGKVATQGNSFRYCSAWSQESTWGYLFLPIDGESVSVPKGLCLLVDIDKSPKLKLVQVDGGAIIFPPKTDDPEHHREFDAHYMMINNGTLEVGTEKHPYTSKLTITMHGLKYDPAMPIYGKKSIGCRFCTLDMHGVHKKSWTDLDVTVEPGATKLTLVEVVDWVVGDTIMVTSTNYNQWEAEFRTITAVDSTIGTKTTLTINSGFRYIHHAGVEELGSIGDTLTVRAEVALMNRNVIYRGDPETSARNKFGAHIMVHSPGDESSIGRISNIQFYDVGQAFLLGKYPIHFHMIGRVTKSYVKNNTVRNSYNRGTTIHGVHYLTVSRNTYFNCMGHTIFVEDAAETKNLIEYNVVAGTKPSFSLLNTDQTPGCFWITHPDNIFVGNRAAGSTNYGYWMDYQDTATGPSFNPNIKPTQSKLGEFRNNIAHSVGNYGLRIFHGHQPPALALYEDHLSYKCGKNGIMGGDLGWVNFKNVTVASCRQHGISFERIFGVAKNINKIDKAIVVGSSKLIGGSTSVGIVGPQSDLWLVSDVRFYHFTGGSGAIGQCTHCQTPKSDNGARTYRFEKLHFDDATVTKRCKYQPPFKGIYHDLDGTLTGLGPNSWATAYWKHNVQPECTLDLEKYDGIICPSTTSVRRIAFHGPVGNIKSKSLYVWQYDDSLTGGKQLRNLQTTGFDKASYLLEQNASTFKYMEKTSPKFHWTMPFVTGHKYYIRWLHGLDFESVKVQIIPWLWEDEQSVSFVMPFYETRAAMYFDSNSGRKANMTFVNTAEDALVMGMNAVYNDTQTRESHFAVNARGGSSDLTIVGQRCIVNCAPQLPPVEDKPVVIEPEETHLWSDPFTWKKLDNRIPLKNEKVVVPSDHFIIYDMGNSPLYDSIEIQGEVVFLEGQDATINTYSLWVRSGTLSAGNTTHPFENKIEIKLHGNNTTPSAFVFSPNIPVGNKNFIITGKVNFYGKPRDTSSRMRTQAYPGKDSFLVAPNLDWKEGDILGLAATNIDARNYETVTIKNYTAGSGQVYLTTNMTKYHFGQADSTADQYNGVDMRGEVMLLTRNIMITASTGSNDTTLAHPEPWPCRVLISDFFEPSNFKYRKGEIHWDYVSIYNCSQSDTKYAALKFDNAVMGVKTFKNSVVASGRAEGIHISRSQRVTMTNNNIHDFVLYGLVAEGAVNIVLENNIMSGVRPSLEDVDEQKLLGWSFPNGGFDLASANAMTVRNNTVSGTWHSGFRMPAKKCDDANPVNKIEDNTAHSISGFGVIVSSGAGKCSEFTKFRGYKNGLATVHMNTGSYSLAKDNVSIDSAYGLAVFAGSRVEVKDNYIYGSKGMRNKDCPLSDNGRCEYCPSRKGVIAPTYGGNPTEIKQSIKISKMFSQGGGWGGTSMFEGNYFIGFDSSVNHCGGSQAAIVNNNWHSDYHPIANFRNNKFRDTDESALYKLHSPPKGWANLQDCGTFTCTGLYNSLFIVERNSYSGVPSVFGMPRSFQVTANNKESVSSQVVPTCKKKDKWNAYLCEKKELGVLLFESQDADRMDRSAQPLYIQDEGRGYDNRLNAYMDHVWDGAYTGQKREQRFPTIVDYSRNYTIEYTGTPPLKQKFTLYGQEGSRGMLVTIQYPDAGAYKVYDSRKQPVIPTDWDYDEETWAVPKGQYCGENRFQGVINKLQFWIKPGCTLYIVPRDAIMLAIRLEWTVKQFFSKKAIGKFTDRMSAALGIHRADMKVVQVYEGSVIVEFIVMSESEPGEGNTQAELQKISDRFEKEAPKLGNTLGAPVMSIMTNGGGVKPMPGYEDQVQDMQRTREGANFNDLISEFLDNRMIEFQYKQVVVPRPEPEVEDQDDVLDPETEVKPEPEPEKEREVIVVREQVTVIEKEAQESTMGLLILIACLLFIVVVVVTATAIILVKKRKAKSHPRIVVREGAEDRETKSRKEDKQEAEDTVLELDQIAEGKQFQMNGRQNDWISSVVVSQKRQRGMRSKDFDALSSYGACSDTDKRTSSALVSQKMRAHDPVINVSSYSSKSRNMNDDFETSALPFRSEMPCIAISEVDSSRKSDAQSEKQLTVAAGEYSLNRFLTGDLMIKPETAGVGHRTFFGKFNEVGPQLDVEDVDGVSKNSKDFSIRSKERSTKSKAPSSVKSSIKQPIPVPEPVPKFPQEEPEGVAIFHDVVAKPAETQFIDISAMPEPIRDRSVSPKYPPRTNVSSRISSSRPMKKPAAQGGIDTKPKKLKAMPKFANMKGHRPTDSQMRSSAYPQAAAAHVDDNLFGQALTGGAIKPDSTCYGQFGGGLDVPTKGLDMGGARPDQTSYGKFAGGTSGLDLPDAGMGAKPEQTAYRKFGAGMKVPAASSELDLPMGGAGVAESRVISSHAPKRPKTNIVLGAAATQEQQQEQSQKKTIKPFMWLNFQPANGREQATESSHMSESDRGGHWQDDGDFGNDGNGDVLKL